MSYRAKNKSSIPNSEIYHAKRRIGSQGLQWLMEEGELTARDRIAKCRAGLLELALVPLYPELDADLSVLMDTLRQRRKDHDKLQYERKKRLQLDVLNRLGIANRAHFIRTPDKELIAKARTLKSDEHKRVFEDMFFDRMNALKAKSFSDEWYKQLNSSHVRDIYYASSSQLSRVLYKRLNSVGPLGQLAAMCLKIQKHAKGIRGNVAHRYKNYRYKQFTTLLEQIIDHLSRHGRLVSGWGIGADHRVRLYPKSSLENESVLCIDLPTGQVGWPLRGTLDAPRYRGTWGSTNDIEESVLSFAESVLRSQHQEIEDPIQAWAKSLKAETPVSKDNQ